MKSLKELYRTGLGPSSSHTMGPRFAALDFARDLPKSTAKIRVTLYGSLAATGRGHLTDLAVSQPFEPMPLEIVWQADHQLPMHPNGMRFEALDDTGDSIASRTLYSIGGGALLGADGKPSGSEPVYPYASMREIMARAESEGLLIWELAWKHEGQALWDYLDAIWETMQQAIHRGINAEGKLPGALNVQRKASSYLARAQDMSNEFKTTSLLFSYALAVAEENAAGGQVATAPTCGSCGVLPAVIYSLRQRANMTRDKIIRALATAGLIGNLVKSNASISGAEVGCQGEIGVACAMAAGAAVQLLGGTVRQIEYAAEMGLEHHLGLTCDPIGGYVQIPCIERNAIAAVRAMDCAIYALLSDGHHIVSFDEVVQTLLETGHDIKASYRETAEGGLAKIHVLRGKIARTS